MGLFITSIFYLRVILNIIAQKTYYQFRKQRKKNTDFIEFSCNYILTLDRFANYFYQKYRNDNQDIEKISKNTEISLSLLQKIKDHIFNNVHMIHENMRRFEADIDIADAWGRLVDGSFTKLDLAFLMHEMGELVIINEMKIDYECAHRITSLHYKWDIK